MRLFRPVLFYLFEELKLLQGLMPDALAQAQQLRFH